MPNMEFFEPAAYQHHSHYHHDQMSHYGDAYAMAQSASMIAMPNVKGNETKPRLGKDEVDILEREFKKNPKPTTQTKRQFAEDMGVDLARINNWFQNRRAKRKQEKKQEAYEAGQAQEALAYSEPSSPDFFSNGNEYYSDTPSLPMQQPIPSFRLIHGPPPAVASYNPQYTDPSTASMESLHRTMAAAHAASEHHDFGNFVEHQESLANFGGSLHDFSNDERAQFPPPDETMDRLSGSQNYSYPSSYSNSLYIEPVRSLTISEMHSLPDESTNLTPTPFSNFQSSRPEAPVSHLMTTFPSQLLPSQLHDGLPTLNDNAFTQSPDDVHESSIDIGFSYDVSDSSESIGSSMSPPGPSIPFKSPPPPMDIASRRKKVQIKPAALVADTFRGRPQMGPRTVSQADGLRRPIDSPGSSPLRRIHSAGGNRNVLSGRIYKSGIESSQRSPINLGGFADAGSFLEHNYQSIRNPSLTAGSSLNSINSSLAPPTPMSPREREMAFAKREGSRSTASPVEGDMQYVFNAGANLASPPETPHSLMVASNAWVNLDVSDKQWSYDVQDEPLFTPAQDSFPVELHMPQPSYLSSMSQPVTPAFGQFNPNFMFGLESPQFKSEPPQYTLSTQAGSEYSFPESHPHYLGTSPASKHKTFHFSHTTAADFSEK